MSKLKLLSFYHDNYNDLIKEVKKSENFVYNDYWWYIHGKLEEALHYDKASIINAKECQDFIKMVPEFNEMKKNKGIWTGTVNSFNFIPYLYIDGVIECEVIGINEPCIGYFWITNEYPMILTSKSKEIYKGTYWDQRGLVCLKSDEEGCNFALKKYNEKVIIL